MIIYKPTNTVFKNRLEARKYFGSGLFNRLVKHTSDFLFINDSTFATNGKTMDSDTQKVSENG
jgi:hypothetical protein